MICIWSSWSHCHLIISCFVKIQNGYPFWCRLTKVVLETPTHTHTHTTILWPFFWDYPGEPVPEEETSSGLYGARGDIRRRHTDNPAGRHSIRTNQWPTSLIPHFYIGCPSCCNSSNLSWLWTSTEYAGLHTQWLGSGCPRKEAVKWVSVWGYQHVRRVAPPPAKTQI